MKFVRLAPVFAIALTLNACMDGQNIRYSEAPDGSSAQRTTIGEQPMDCTVASRTTASVSGVVSEKGEGDTVTRCRSTTPARQFANEARDYRNVTRQVGGVVREAGRAVESVREFFKFGR